MVYKELTQNEFDEFKRDYDVYGTHNEMDNYRNEYAVRDDTPKCTIHTMWQPLTDYVAIAEYGKAVSKMFYAIVYEDYDIDYGDIILYKDEEYEVKGIKYFNTYNRIDIQKKEVKNG